MGREGPAFRVGELSAQLSVRKASRRRPCSRWGLKAGHRQSHTEAMSTPVLHHSLPLLLLP